MSYTDNLCRESRLRIFSDNYQNLSTAAFYYSTILQYYLIISVSLRLVIISSPTTIIQCWKKSSCLCIPYNYHSCICTGQLYTWSLSLWASTGITFITGSGNVSCLGFWCAIQPLRKSQLPPSKYNPLTKHPVKQRVKKAAMTWYLTRVMCTLTFSGQLLDVLCSITIGLFILPCLWW